MNDHDTKQPESDEPALPPALVAALRQAHAGAAPARAGFDAAVLAQAKSELTALYAARRRRMKFAAWLGGGLGVAAAVALAVLLTLQEPAGRPRTGDIRDAFALARALRDGVPTVADDDRNHDGAVDGNDVRLLAFAAVALKEDRR